MSEEKCGCRIVWNKEKVADYKAPHFEEDENGNLEPVGGQFETHRLKPEIILCPRHSEAHVAELEQQLATERQDEQAVRQDEREKCAKQFVEAMRGLHGPIRNRKEGD